MPQQMSNYFVQAIEDFYFGKNNTTLAPPANWYVCMFTSDPGLADSGGVEPSGNGYARLVIPNTTAYWASATSRQKNAAGASYPLAWFTATGTVGTIVATGVRDASSGGNLILLCSIPTGQQTITSGNIITFNAADFTWRID